MLQSNSTEHYQKAIHEPDEEAPKLAKAMNEALGPRDDLESLEDGGSNLDIAEFSGIHVNLRNAFLRRVYGLLTAQLAVTAGICSFCSLYQPAAGLLLAYPQAFLYTSLLPTIGALIALAFLKSVHPWNAVLLLIFNIFESISLGVICAAYSSSGMADILVSAAGLTLAIFLCLTTYVLFSKKDFSFLGGFLFTMLVAMIGWGLLNIIFGWRVHFIYSCLGALLFSAFILYDTSCILLQYSYDEHIIASIQLYLDILNLFMYILRLLSSNRN